MLPTTLLIYPPNTWVLDLSSLLSYEMLTIPSLTQLSAKAGATHGEAPHRNLHLGNTSLDIFQPVKEDIIFPDVKDFNSTVDTVFKHLGMWKIVAFLNFQD